MVTVVAVMPGAEAELPEPDPEPLPHAAARSVAAPPSATTAHGLDLLIRVAMALLLWSWRASHCVTALVLMGRRAARSLASESHAQAGGPATPGRPGGRVGIRASPRPAPRHRLPAARCWRRRWTG